GQSSWMELSVPLPDDRAGPYPLTTTSELFSCPRQILRRRRVQASANFVSDPTVPPLGQNGNGIFQDPLTTLVCILWG
ncbi:MAG: hypothetical protein ACE1Z6_10495, partial [Candidatus Methylomirabilales bacterium]